MTMPRMTAQATTMGNHSTIMTTTLEESNNTHASSNQTDAIGTPTNWFRKAKGVHQVVRW